MNTISFYMRNLLAVYNRAVPERVYSTGQYFPTPLVLFIPH